MCLDLFWVFLSSIIPITELRGAIPLGIFVFQLDPLIVFAAAILGNFLVAPFLLIFLKYFSEFLMHKFYFFNRLLNYIFTRTRNHHEHKFEKWEHRALFILVALPLPFTGAWTGSIAAFLFGVPFKRSVAIIFLGLVVAGAIMTGLSVLGNGAVNGL